jgi:DNA polymerase-3 subunit delta
MTPAQYIARLKRSEVPPVTLFLGQEGYERRRCRQALILATVGSDQSAITQHDLSQSALAEVIDDARAMNLFVTRRLILATSAEAALPRTGGKAGSSDDDDDDDAPSKSAGGGGFDALAAYIKDPSPDITLVFEATRFDFEGDDKRKIDRVRKFFSAIPDVVEFKRHTPDEARQEAQAMVRRAQITVAPAALEMLIESLGADVSRLFTEIEKLSLYGQSGRPINEEEIASLIPDARETTIFALVNALGRRDRTKALGILDTLCRDGEYLPLALSFLSAQFRTALIAKEANLRTSQQIQGHFSKLGIPMWGSRAEQVAQTMGKFTKEQLQRGMKLIFEADRALRSPRPDDRIVMESFVAALTA